MDLQLKDKLALVSGSTAGIGLLGKPAAQAAYIASPPVSSTGAALRVGGGTVKSAF